MSNCKLFLNYSIKNLSADIKKFQILFFIFLTIFLITEGFAQDTTSSLAFKKNRPRTIRGGFFYQPDLSYQIWQQFNLIREANAGDVLAQHELGLRYLLGEGIAADTIKGAYWIHKAAEKGLTAASFNYGILLINGWGVNWNPFAAYKYFLDAANDGMPQAEYIVGILFTDNLIIKKDLNKAYYWIKKSVKGNYEPAKQILTEISSKVDTSKIKLDNNIVSNKTKKDTANQKNNQSLPNSLGLVLIDFTVDQDTTTHISDSTLVDDILLIGSDDLNKELGLKEKDNSIDSIKKSGISSLLKFADSGSPEALTFIGRLYEKGIYYSKDIVAASAYYVRAIKLDSPRSPFLLYELIKTKDYFENLKTNIDENIPDAMFVWYGIHSLGFANLITDDDANKLLQNAASKYYIPAIVELGLNYFTGKYVKKDKQNGLSIWQNAVKFGSVEAKVRIKTAEVYGEIQSQSYDDAVKDLKDAEKSGSVLAQVTLGYCYEKGIGLNQDKGEAAKEYRFAARRGNRYAYDQLKRLYDEIRPPDPMFQVN